MATQDHKQHCDSHSDSIHPALAGAGCGLFVYYKYCDHKPFVHICYISSIGIKLLTSSLCMSFDFLSDDKLLSNYVLHVFIASTVYRVLFHIYHFTL